MTLSDDDVVGKVQVDTIHGTYGDQLVETEVFEPVHFRDLDEHIQDRLRAAEQMAEALQFAVDVAEADAGRPMDAYDRGYRMVVALATYQATFQEADT